MNVSINLKNEKNNIKLFLFLCFLCSIGSIIINSCQKDPIGEKTTVKTDSYFVDSQTASNYSEKVICSTVFQSIQSSNLNSKTTPKIIKNLKTILDENKLAAYYMINYEEGGFVIFSADKRITPILAYSEDGCLPYGYEEIPGALEDWLTSVKENIESVRSSNQTATNEVELQWKNIENEGNNYPVLKNATPDPPCTGTFEQKGPFLATKWHQGCGFNTLLPQKKNMTGCVGVVPPCDRAHAGCTTIAMAQVMKFHQRPTTYNWSQMPNRMPAAPYPTEPARLVYDIFYACGPQSYSCDGTAIDPAVAASVFKSKFGYSSATYGSYNFNTVKSNLRSNRPVILGSSGGIEAHGWVCDGFQEDQICLYDGSGVNIGKVTYLFLSMVWGDIYQRGDGWYAFDNFNPPGHDYNSNKEMIYNIIP